MARVHEPHLRSEYITSVRSEMVRDSIGNPDWIFYYRPGPRAFREYALFNTSAARALPDPAAEEITSEEMKADWPSPHDLVRRFHFLVKGLTKYTPRPKEIGQAERLLEWNGPVKARFIVDFAARRAKETHFDVQQFGGLFVYLGEAEAAFARYLAMRARAAESAADSRAAAQQEQRYQEAYSAARPRAERMLEDMDDDRREALRLEVESTIDKSAPSMRRNLDTHRFDEAVRGVMLQMLVRRILEVD
jgi:hypothetical protein